jgi:methylated-DNA-[protein]-cysteine S-methyltransferase
MSQTPPDTLTLDRFPTPIGEALLVTDPEGRLRAFDWHGYEDRMHRLMRLHYGPRATLSHGRAPAAIVHALEAYFAGNLTAIDSIPCLTGGTNFQRSVWTALREIPAGKTWSYSDMAIRIGTPKAVRAVGLANGANPIGLVVPCHRVIGADGSLTGYGGGIERKRWLLQHEGASTLTLDWECLTPSGTALNSTTK